MWEHRKEETFRRYWQTSCSMNLIRKWKSEGLTLYDMQMTVLSWLEVKCLQIRVMRNISRFIEEKLGLKVNMTKSKVDRPSGLKYLGFGFYFDPRAHQFKAKPHAKSVAKFKKRMKELTCRSWGVSNSYKVEKLNQLIRGWINYFKIGSMKTLMQGIRFKNPLSASHVHLETMENTAESSRRTLIKLGIDRNTARQSCIHR